MEVATPARGAHGKIVLVTGVRGFTGAHMRRELEHAGYHVIGTVLHNAGDKLEVSEVELDITSAKACRQVVETNEPDFVVHLAGIAFLQHPDPVDFYRTNVVGTMNLLNALAEAAHVPKKVLIVSSANIYGNVGGDLIGESQSPAPVNHYAASKLSMEHMATTLFEQLPLIIARPFNYTGIDQEPHFLVPKIVSHFARRESRIELGNIDIKRDFSDVTMVVDAYRRLLECGARSATLNVCTGRATSLRSVISMMESIAGYRIEVRVNPRFVRSNDIRRLTGDPAALIAAIGELNAPPLRLTLERIYRSMRGISDQSAD